MKRGAAEPGLSLGDFLLDEELVVAREGMLGQYELVFEGPSGGMATIFMAVKPGPSGFRKVVALKRIHPHLVKTRTFVDMFIDEARVASLLVHPFVCGVQDFGESDGTYFLVMEYLLGESLRDLLRLARRRHKPPPPAVLARIFADLCEGLHAAHELTDDAGCPLGLVHRDVSPSNLFVLYDGSVRVTDFGIARMRGAMHHTGAGAVRGKLHYMSPEQVRGDALDRRSDLWSMGVTLWESICGRSLFGTKNEGETISRITGLAVPPPSSVVKGAPRCFDPIIARCLARDPRARYASARELADELDDVSASFGARARMVEVSDWISDLCPGTRELKLEMMRAARAGGRFTYPSSDIFPRPAGARGKAAARLRLESETPTKPESPDALASQVPGDSIEGLPDATRAAILPGRLACVAKAALLGALLTLGVVRHVGSCADPAARAHHAVEAARTRLVSPGSGS